MSVSRCSDTVSIIVGDKSVLRFVCEKIQGHGEDTLSCRHSGRVTLQGVELVLEWDASQGEQQNKKDVCLNFD